jgi:hypothetical protein
MIASIADLVAFLKVFHRHWLEAPSLNAALIPADLPPGMATIYRELGALVEIEPGRNNDWHAPFAAQDALLPLSRLKWIDAMVEFACENQDNWFARCPIGQPDPPVYSDAADVWEAVPRGFVAVCDSLNHFLTTLCLQEAVMGSRYLLALHTDLAANQVLTVPLEPLWLNGYYVDGEPRHHFFASRDRDVLVMDYAGTWVASPIREVTGLVAHGIRVQAIH